MHKSDKTEAENEREQLLVDQCVFLTEEQEYVMVPAPGSGVPGKIQSNVFRFDFNILITMSN